MSWRPVRGKPGLVECVKHGREFKRGQACALCTPDNADGTDVVSEASGLAIEARRRRLPEMLDHEQTWNRLARKLEKKADKQKGIAAQRLYDSAMKALRQATVICEWREDWQRVERLEKADGAMVDGEPEGTVDAPSGVH